MGKGDEEDADDPVLDPGSSAPVEGDVGIPGAFAVAGGIAGFVLGAALGPIVGFSVIHPLCVIAGAAGGWFGGKQLLELRYDPDEEEEAPAASGTPLAAVPSPASPTTTSPAATPPATPTPDPLAAPTPTTGGGPSSELDHSLGSKVADDASGLDHSLGSSPGHERPPG